MRSQAKGIGCNIHTIPRAALALNGWTLHP